MSGGGQERKQIRPRRAAAAGADEPEHGGIERGQRRSEPTVFRGRHPVGPSDQLAEPVLNAFGHDSDGIGKGAAIPVVAAAEQRGQGNPAGERNHLGVQVQFLPGLPVGDMSPGLVDHHRGEHGYTVLEKRRLCEPPLLEPRIAFAGNEPVAEQGQDQPLPRMLAVMPGVRDQYLLDQVGMIDQDDPAGTEAEGDCVPEFPGTPGEKVEEVSKLVDVAAEEAATRAGRRSGARHDGSGRSSRFTLLAT